MKCSCNGETIYSLKSNKLQRSAMFIKCMQIGKSVLIFKMLRKTHKGQITLLRMFSLTEYTKPKIHRNS